MRINMYNNTLQIVRILNGWLLIMPQKIHDVEIDWESMGAKMVDRLRPKDDIMDAINEPEPIRVEQKEPMHIPGDMNTCYFKTIADLFAHLAELDTKEAD